MPTPQQCALFPAVTSLPVPFIQSAAQDCHRNEIAVMDEDQDSVSFDLSASEQQRLKEYEEEDEELMPPPVSKQPTPMDPIFDKKNHPALANPQDDAGKGLPLRPTREVSMGVSKLGSMRIASQSQDVDDDEDTG